VHASQAGRTRGGFIHPPAQSLARFSLPEREFFSEYRCLICSKIGHAALVLTVGTTTRRVQSLDL
jgi:hypothetical protein